METLLLNTEEAAKLTGVSPHKLQLDRYYRRGLPYVRFQRSVRYCLEDIKDFIERNKIRPAAA